MGPVFGLHCFRLTYGMGKVVAVTQWNLDNDGYLLASAYAKKKQSAAAIEQDIVAPFCKIYRRFLHNL